MHEILADIHSACQGGAQEFVLTGVHLGSWGHDFELPSDLSQLIGVILTETDTPRLHLSSLEPWDVSSAFFALWQNPRLCRHLHLPLQSGSEATLKRMRRRITPQSYAKLIHQARATIPGVAITTDIIVGFPGESEEEFHESAAFVKEMAFSGGHIFTYSARPGTAALHLPNQVPHFLAKQRSAHIREIVQASSSSFLEAQLGQEKMALWEKATPINASQWQLGGLTENYLRIRANSPVPCCNKIMRVHIVGFEQGELVGKIAQPYSCLLEAQDTI